jgi:dolichol-phosphate mannosyltransferase
MDNLQILMPAHNEEKSIYYQINNVNDVLKGKFNFSFLICEDGSTDKTLQILKNIKKKYKLKIITKKYKQGYSRAVMNGIQKANSDYLLVMDSDGQCDPKEILKFWNKRKSSDIVCGWRIKRKDFLYRKFFSDFARLIYTLFFNVNLKDPSFAFSLINRKTYKTLSKFKPSMPDGFFWEFNARANHQGFTFKEIGINHKKRKYGNTQIFHLHKLPIIALINFLGMIKIKLDMLF